MTNKLPDEFIARILGDDSIPNPEGLLDELASGNPSVSIRHNRLKGCRPTQDADIVPWCPQGEYLPERRAFTFDPAFHQGRYYVQDSSSMALAAVIESLGLENPVCYLDACAAPGGKTTVAIDSLPAGS
ncbi:MAG: rRNA cytosine-C5-methyltransferase, partial [Muribaculaceae bacterium]|nr:rRNA cytosine-C5-methyltransferase [Muribaculaceae bacterium]